MNPGLVDSDLLRLAAFVAYLASLFVFAGAAVWGMAPGHAAVGSISLKGTIGTLLQLAGGWIVTRAATGGGELRPQTWELIGMLILTPASAWLFVAAQVPASRSVGELVTDGAYAWVRHPMYLAFLGLLTATGFAVSARWLLLAGLAVYVVGTEMRISLEESGLQLQRYAVYRARVRWRYLPGLR